MSALKAAVIGVAHSHAGTLYRSLLAAGDVEFIGWADTDESDKTIEKNRKVFLNSQFITFSKKGVKVFPR